MSRTSLTISSPKLFCPYGGKSKPKYSLLGHFSPQLNADNPTISTKLIIPGYVGGNSQLRERCPQIKLNQYSIAQVTCSWAKVGRKVT